jgi:post-segregation antitoxin (ccd killing protein)
MPTIYLRKDLYDRLVGLGIDVSLFVNTAVEAQLDARGKKKQ